MDLKQHMRVLREQWYVIVASTVIFVALAAVFAWTATPKYAAHVRLFVSTKNGSDASTLSQGSTFGQQRVISYADIVSSRQVLVAVQKQLGLEKVRTVRQLQNEITASAPLNTVLVNVTATDTDPVRAMNIANAVGTQFTTYVNQLETPQGSDVSPVKVSVTEPADLPGAPVSPDKKRDLILGLLVGFALGVGIAVLRETLDTTVGGREQAAELTDAPVLAAFREDEKNKQRPLIVSDDSFSPRAEAFRQLRTNIRYLSVDSSVRSLVVTSSVESEGKTTVAANLAISLAQSGEHVILVDADLRRPRLGELLGLNPEIGLTDVLVGTTHLDNALKTWREGVSLRVLTSGGVPPNPSEILGSLRMQELLDEMLSRATVVVLDSPPLLPVTDAAILSTLTDGAVLVTRVGKTKREALASSADAIRHVGGHVLGVVLNRVPARRKSTSYGYGYGYAGYHSTVAADPAVAEEAAVKPR